MIMPENSTLRRSKDRQQSKLEQTLLMNEGKLGSRSQALLIYVSAEVTAKSAREKFQQPSSGNRQLGLAVALRGIIFRDPNASR